jgi:hypothetical protein
LAFNMSDGSVKNVVGRMTRDGVLVELATLQRAEFQRASSEVALEAEATSRSYALRQDNEAEQARLAEQGKEASTRSATIAPKPVPEGTGCPRRTQRERTSGRSSGGHDEG